MLNLKEEAVAPVCLNCGETLLGDYCWQCGQEARDLHKPFTQLLLDLLGDAFSFDSRILRSVGPLLFKPGFLTREHIAGRRVRYIPPLRIYLFITLIFFGFIATRPPRRIEVVRADPVWTARSPLVQEPTPAAQKTGSRVTFTFPKFKEDTALGRRLAAAGRRAQQNPQKFGEAVLENLPRSFFLALPAFALLLKLLYRRRDHLYFDHLVFALHYHSFAFVILILLMVLGKDWVPNAVALPFVIALWAWFFAYLAVALRNVFGGSWPGTLLRYLGLLAGYGFVFMLTVLGMAFVTLWMY